MNRFAVVTLALILSLSVGRGAEPPPANLPTLAGLEALERPAVSGPDYWPWALRTTAQVWQLVESDTLTSGEDLYRASKLVLAADVSFRAERVRYELLLSSAALDHAPAAKEIALAWDRLLHSLGRPLRTDVGGLAQRNAEFYSLEPAPASVQAVLRDPEQAREQAKTSARNEEVKKIVDADQADRRADWSKLSAEERRATGERDHERNRRIREIIAAGELRTKEDFASAALVMQHSAVFSGYQTAHELAVCAMLLGDRSLGRWLIAATYDRMLGSVGHAQRFGTQFRGMGGATTLVTVDTLGICDAERSALGCPTLEKARNRKARSAASPVGDAKLVAAFTGADRAIRDPQFGLEATIPDGWKLNDVKRWGDQQNTLFFALAADAEPRPSFYYRVYHTARPMPSEALAAHVRDEAEKKQEARRGGFSDYTNRSEGVRVFQVGAYPAFSWLADFTSSDGGKWSEYFVRFQTDAADASFFLQAPREKIDALRPMVDRFMATVKMPELAK